MVVPAIIDEEKQKDEELPTGVETEIRPGLELEPAAERYRAPHDTSVASTCGMLRSWDFAALLVIFLAGVLVLLWSSVTNATMVAQAAQYGLLDLMYLIIISFVVAFLGAYACYIPYVLELTYQRRLVLWAAFFWNISLAIWALTVFNARTDYSLPLLFATLLVISSIWLLWVCTHRYLLSIYPCIVIFSWSVYLLVYTISLTYNS